MAVWRAARIRQSAAARQQADLPFPMTTRIARNTRLILIGAGVLLSLGMGLRQSLGLFLIPVTRDLAVSAADFTLSLAIQNIVWGLSQAPIGAIADRFGLRLTMMFGAVTYVVGLGIMAAAGGVPDWFPARSSGWPYPAPPPRWR